MQTSRGDIFFLLLLLSSLRRLSFYSRSRARVRRQFKLEFMNAAAGRSFASPGKAMIFVERRRAGEVDEGLGLWEV